MEKSKEGNWEGKLLAKCEFSGHCWSLKWFNPLATQGLLGFRVLTFDKNVVQESDTGT